MIDKPFLLWYNITMKGVKKLEIWKDIDGFEGLYQISSCGRVKSLHYYGGNRKKTLKLQHDKDGYLVVGLRNGAIQVNRKVHRLVALAFIPNPDNLPQINHKDEDKENNLVENLEWCTNKYNVNYGNHSLHAAQAQMGKRHTAEHIMKIRSNAPGSKPVLMIEPETMNVIAEFVSASEAARQIGGTATNVSYACRHESSKYKGLFWRYK